jgi:hypothetical protein
VSRDINDFKKGYELRTNTVKDETDHLFTGYDSILASWKNRFTQHFSVQGVAILSRQQYVHQKHESLSRVPLICGGY